MLETVNMFYIGMVNFSNKKNAIFVQGSHREASKNFNDFLMIFQDKNPKFPW